MDAELRALVSRSVTETWQADGVTELGFAHGSVLSIAWPHSFERLPSRGLAGLVGQRLISLSCGADHLVLEFSGGAKLTVQGAEERPGPGGFALRTRLGRVVEWRPFQDDEAAA